MRLFLPSPLKLHGPAICLALWPYSPSCRQALLCCQVGLLPLLQLFLYIWSQEGVLELPLGGLELNSCVPGFLRKSCSLEAETRLGWDGIDREGQWLGRDRGGGHHISDTAGTVQRTASLIQQKTPEQQLK